MDPVTNPGATPAVPAASPAAPGTSAVPASPADGSAPASPAGSPEHPNLRQLREQYETTKRTLEPWEKLGKYDEVAPRYQIATQLHQEATELAEQLGYDAAEVEALFREDPVSVLAHLRQRANSAQPTALNPRDIQNQIKKLVEENLKPVTQREEARLTNEAESRFNGEFDRLFKTDFKDGLPDECRDAIYELASSAMGNDDAALARLKFGQQTSDVAKYFNEAKTRFLKVMNAYVQYEQKRTGNPPPNPTSAPQKPASRMDGKLSTGQSLQELFR